MKPIPKKIADRIDELTDTMFCPINEISEWSDCSTVATTIAQELLEIIEDLRGSLEWSLREIDSNLDREGGHTHCVVADKLEQALEKLNEKLGEEA